MVGSVPLKKGCFRAYPIINKGITIFPEAFTKVTNTLGDKSPHFEALSSCRKFK
jgi:hypothetical protein